jgi:hypothetical protein
MNNFFWFLIFVDLFRYFILRRSWRRPARYDIRGSPDPYGRYIYSPNHVETLGFMRLRIHILRYGNFYKNVFFQLSLFANKLLYEQ